MHQCSLCVSVWMCVCVCVCVFSNVWAESLGGAEGEPLAQQ